MAQLRQTKFFVVLAVGAKRVVGHAELTTKVTRRPTGEALDTLSKDAKEATVLSKWKCAIGSQGIGLVYSSLLG